MAKMIILKNSLRFSNMIFWTDQFHELLKLQLQFYDVLQHSMLNYFTTKPPSNPNLSTFSKPGPPYLTYLLLCTPIDKLFQMEPTLPDIVFPFFTF